MLTAGRVVPRDHAVAFYDHDAELVACLTDFVVEGLQRDEGVVVVATRVHREAVAQALAQRGLHVGALEAAGRYLAVDAAETLQAVMVQGVPAALSFRAAVGGMLDRVSAVGRPIRVFGEMVALLWAQHEEAAAVQLEWLWNELAQDRRFLLLCAYPTATLAGDSGLTPLAEVCHAHSTLLAPDSYRSQVVVLGSADGTGGRTETFVPVPESIRVARRFLACTLRAWQEEALLADAELMVSELATNAVRHARSPFRVSLVRSGGSLRIAVDDLGAGVPREIGQSADGVSGRGIALVAALSEHWGIDRGEVGKTVWAELPLGGSAAASA